MIACVDGFEVFPFGSSVHNVTLLLQAIEGLHYILRNDTSSGYLLDCAIRPLTVIRRAVYNRARCVRGIIG